MANKRGTKYFSKPGEDSFLKSENYFLRKKNEDLAKALSETKIEHQKLIQNSLQLHERLYATDVQRIKYKEFINTFSLDMQMYIQQFISMTEQMTNMLNKVNTVIRSPEALDRLLITNNNTSQSLKTPNNQNSKTMMAVMPMISGHTILSPKVNLPRVSVRQLVDMAESSHGDEAASSHEIAPDEVEFSDNVDVSPNDEYLLENDSETANEPQNNRLETMQEENEDEERQSDISSQALLSGVFKDVKVYISPLANQHVIQFKSGTSRRLDSKAFNKSNHSLSARNSLLSSSGSRTLTQSNDSSRSIDSDANESNVVQTKHERIDQTRGISSCSRTAVDDYDPMEGPSNAVNSIREIAEYFRPCPNETSTPYLPESKAGKLNNSSTLDGTTTPIPKNVTRRRGNSRKARTLSSKLSNCSVILNKLSPKTMKTYNWEIESSPTRESTANVKERNDSPTVLERSRRSSAQLTNGNRKRNNSDTSYFSGDSPKSQRVRRNVKPIAYKEQSLRKKLRR